MNYWVLKGNPRTNDWDTMLQPGRVDLWHSGRFPKTLTSGDRLFCWESTPELRLVGLALLQETNCGTDEYGDALFRVKYLTHRLSSMPNVHELRQLPLLNTASFLKSGPATTLFPLAREQAEVLFRLLLSRNPELEKIWPDLGSVPYAGLAPDVDITTAVTEGGRKLVTHLVRERSQAIVAAKKQQILSATGQLICEVCGFNFNAFYGVLGEGFCEVHHRIPLSDVDSSRETRLEDLAILCSNCHRIIHRSVPFLAVEELRTRIHKTD